MDSKRIGEIMQSHGVINVSYNGMSVWIEGVQGDVAKVSLIGMDRKMDLPISALTETDPIQTI